MAGWRSWETQAVTSLVGKEPELVREVKIHQLDGVALTSTCGQFQQQQVKDVSLRSHAFGLSYVCRVALLSASDDASSCRSVCKHKLSIIISSKADTGY